MIYYLLLKPNPVSTKIDVFFNLKYLHDILYTEESKLQNEKTISNQAVLLYSCHK